MASEKKSRQKIRFVAQSDILGPKQTLYIARAGDCYVHYIKKDKHHLAWWIEGTDLAAYDQCSKRPSKKARKAIARALEVHRYRQAYRVASSKQIAASGAPAAPRAVGNREEGEAMMKRLIDEIRAMDMPLDEPDRGD